MGKKVLVIDDSAVFRKVVALNLKNAGYEVGEAGDGIEGYQKITTEKYDIVVCDVNMPNMDGLAFVEKVRATESVRYIPIIMLTTESQEEKKLKGLEIGAKAWLVKPFQPAQLLKALEKLLP